VNPPGMSGDLTLFDLEGRFESCRVQIIIGILLS